jgi:hypothetical protein
LRINIENNFGGEIHKSFPNVLTLGLEPQIAINKDDESATAIPLHVDLIITAMCVLEITEGTDYCDANYGTLQEVDWKYPNYRTYRADAITGEPSIIQPSLHTEPPCENEIGANTTAINRAVPTTWAWNLNTATNQDDVYNESLKLIAEDPVSYYPYLTKTMKKKSEESSTQAPKKKHKRDVEYDSDEENLN